MKYRYVNREFGIDLGGKYSYHGFIIGVISNVSSLYKLGCLWQRLLCSPLVWCVLNKFTYDFTP